MKKTKIFLGGLINYTNAQNLNCLALAKHLNKDQFEVYTLQYHAGTLADQKGKMKGVNIFNCFRPGRLSLYLGFLWGIWRCDVAYLPKEQLLGWNRFLLKLFNKKSFSTIEGIMDNTVVKSIDNHLGSFSKFIESKSMFDKLYSITHYMRTYNDRVISLKTENRILYLGVDPDHFKKAKTKTQLRNILIIGNDLIRKGIYDYLAVAQHFPMLNFYVVGSGLGKIDVNEEANKLKLNNVIYKGLQTHQQIIELLDDIDLHILPSRSEGFPKVTLETAAAGIPSILYDDYGADEWINNGVDSWAIKTIGDIIKVIAELKENPLKIQAASIAAVTLAQSFDWKERVKDWEEVIIDIHQN